MTSQASANSPVFRRMLGILAVGLCLAAGVAAAWMGRGWLLPRAARWLNVGQRPTRCDYLLVLPGGEETRPFAAAALVRAGLARQVLIPRTGSSPDVSEGIRRPAHEINRQVLLHEGVAPTDIVLIGQASGSTYADAEALAEFLKPRSQSSIAVVTNHYHTRRASWVLRQVLGDRADKVHMVAVPVDGFDEDTWWQTRDGTLTYTTEFAKLAAYAIGYSPTRTWLIGLALVGAAAALIWHRGRAKRSI